MVTIITTVLAWSILVMEVFSDEASSPSSSHNMCSRGNSCVKKEECLALLQGRNSSSDDFLYSCGENANWVCCPPTSPVPRMTMENLTAMSECGVATESRIFGGSDAYIGQFPWMALIAYRSNDSNEALDFRCGGTLINNRYVLTAAHCLLHGNPTFVRLGELDLSKDIDCDEDVCADPPVDMEIERIVLHANYNTPFLKNDIALLRLKENVHVTEYVSPICLPINMNVTGEERNKRYQVAGWGSVKKDNRNGSKTLLHTRVDNVPVSVCNKAQPNMVRPIGDLQLCAALRRTSDVCKGDSGGPMMDMRLDQRVIRTYLVGIVSFGFGACGGDVPSVYTRVTSYLTWILSNLEP